MNSYNLSRAFFDFAFENPEKIRPNHVAVYFFAIEHCNRLGWKEKFGFPSQMVMEAVGIKNWRTYSKALNDLVEFGFIEMVEISKNQFSSNIIAIVKNTKANTKATTKALDKALQKHSTKHSQSIVSIDKQLTSNNITKNIEERKAEFKNSLHPLFFNENDLNDFYHYWTEHGINDKKMRWEKEKSFGIERRVSTWMRNKEKFSNKPQKEKLTGAQEFIQQFENLEL